jgi:hypothetical protein
VHGQADPSVGPSCQPLSAPRSTAGSASRSVTLGNFGPHPRPQVTITANSARRILHPRHGFCARKRVKGYDTAWPPDRYPGAVIRPRRSGCILHQSVSVSSQSAPPPVNGRSQSFVVHLVRRRSPAR